MECRNTLGAVLRPVGVNAERLRFSIVREPVRPDVWIESQHIRGVVLLLDLHEASIVCPVSYPDDLATRVAQFVGVQPMRKELQIVTMSVYPLRRAKEPLRRFLILR